jgi:hypothetical protein
MELLNEEWNALLRLRTHAEAPEEALARQLLSARYAMRTPRGDLAITGAGHEALLRWRRGLTPQTSTDEEEAAPADAGEEADRSDEPEAESEAESGMDSVGEDAAVD